MTWLGPELCWRQLSGGAVRPVSVVCNVPGLEVAEPGDGY